jgi:hypothetical protein
MRFESLRQSNIKMSYPTKKLSLTQHLNHSGTLKSNSKALLLSLQIMETYFRRSVSIRRKVPSSLREKYGKSLSRLSEG